MHLEFAPKARGLVGVEDKIAGFHVVNLNSNTRVLHEYYAHACCSEHLSVREKSLIGDTND